MFFNMRWFQKNEAYILLKELNIVDDVSIENFVDKLFEEKKNGVNVYNVIDLDAERKVSTPFQKINLIWFFFVFWCFFAPYQYIKNGLKGFDQRKMSGKIVEKIIGEYYIKGKRKDYKSGWCYYMSKQELINRFKDCNIYTTKDLRSTYKFENLEELGIIIENENKIYRSERTKLNRFNEFWVFPLAFSLLPIFGTINWFKNNEFAYKQNGKILKLINKFVKPQ